MSIDRTLGDDERVVLQTRPHVKMVFGPFLVLLLAAAGIVAALLLLPDNDSKTWLMAAIGVVALVVIVVWTLVPYLQWRTTSYTFTTRRLITRSGILTKTGRDIPLFRINDFTYERDLLDQMLGCGTIVVSDATEKAGVLLYDVPRVAEVKKQLSELLFKADDGSDDGEFPPTDPRSGRRR